MAREDDIRKIVTGGRARGLGDDQIRALVTRYDQRAAEQPPAVAAKPSTPAGGWLPDAGALGGSILGSLTGPLAPVTRVLGAGIGGALGKGAEMFFDEKDDTLMGSLKAMGAEGAKQGGMEIAGGVAGKGLKLLGRGAYQGGIALLPKGIKQEFAKEGMGKVGFKRNIALTARGAKKADKEIAKSSEEAKNLLWKADERGAKQITPNDVLRHGDMEKVADKAARREQLGRTDEVEKVLGRVTDFVKRNRDPIRLTKAQPLKREAQELAEPVFRALDKGNVVRDTDALVDRSLAKGYRRSIEESAKGVDIDVAPINRTTEALIGLKEGAQHAADTGHILSRLGGAGIGAGIAGFTGGMFPAVAAAGAGSLFTTPGGLTRTGLGLKGLGQATYFAPDAARVAALLNLLANPPQGDTQ